MACPQIAYIVHDLADAAVARRMAMLGRGGALFRLAGFRRTATGIDSVAGITALDLGRTQDGRLLARVVTVLFGCMAAPRWGRRLAGADIVIARNLEMLLLAWCARAIFARRSALVYELLDVHRLLASAGPGAAILRQLEGWLLRRCHGVIISSPAFETQYLKRHYPRLPTILLIENKTLASHSTALAPLIAPGPPWRIGWFGILRCRRSLECLATLARQHPGLIEVELRGKIATSIVDIFEDIVAATPGMTYHGAYRAPDDLAAMYGSMHFAWAIDYYEDGQNSRWLLPNRLYESAYYGSVPIAVPDVETASWLTRKGIGFVLSGPPEQALESFFTTMTARAHSEASARVRVSPRQIFAYDEGDCVTLARALLERVPRALAD